MKLSEIDYLKRQSFWPSFIRIGQKLWIFYHLSIFKVSCFLLLRLYFVDSICTNIEFTLFLQQHGSISQQGLLLQVGDAIRYKKFAKRGKTKFKECMVFIFRETVMICEKVKVVNAFSPPQLNYWVSFQVKICL